VISTLRTNRKRNIIKTLLRQRYLYLLFLPGALYYIIFKYAPMFGVVIAFQNYNVFDGFFGSDWVGFKHFQSFFSNPIFWRLIENTLLLNIYLLLWGFPAPILLALMINEVRNNTFKRFVQTVSYLPHFITTVIIVGIVTDIMSPSTGAIGKALNSLLGQEIIFMSDAAWFRTIYVAADIWRGIGWGTIIYLAALSGVDVALYEAAMIDGAGKLKRMLYITIPCIVPTIIIVLILRMGSILSVGFETVYLMQTPLNTQTSEVLSTFVYKRGLSGGQYSYGTAVDLFNSIIGFVLLITVNRISSKVSETSLW